MRQNTLLILVIPFALVVASYFLGENSMAFLRRVFNKSKSPKQNLAATSGAPKIMTDNDMDEVTQQTSAVTLTSDDPTAAAVPYEVATFALS